MSLMNKREATGLSIVELSNRIASLYNTELSPELIERIESKQTKLKNEDAQILAEFFNTTSEDLM
ncbi:helix-turn-helix domain-containing protein [Staphylococcus equorum]|uniref:Helix-turn-helix domain-containing protein n=1 Tax=Staphylococcus equorum TaxID=246432 RepID=A0A9X4L8S9_9STAP|nr:helix-turn-helix transcriptional regulator [Staphylococcus equorum]MDG0843307.1 helix-turn-helix domain-containing protein [Staphylococcus equorum]MDG0858618.1 helix-turn-helix domain-containing protein [Staphylococcus equorum]